MESFWKDLKYSFQMMRRTPTLSIAAIAALTLGIGANTAIFSIVDTVLLKPLHAPDPDRIVQFLLATPAFRSPGGSPQQFFLWRQQYRVFQDVSAYRLELVNLTQQSDPEQLPAARVSAGFFRLFGAPVIQGRTFTAGEDRPGGGHVVVLSYGLWARRFASDPRMIGKTVPINGVAHLVAGVLHPSFIPEEFDESPAVWLPFQIDPNGTEGFCYCRVAGRLNSHVTVAGANAQLQVAADEFRRAFPKLMNPRTTFAVEPMRDSITGDVRAPLMILFGAVAFVLLIACSNVASLLIARAAARKREIAIRAAVGASRGRIIRQLLTESMAFALAGGALGLAVGWAAIRSLLAFYPSNPLLAPLNTINIPRIGDQPSGVGLDWRILAFTVLVSGITAVLFGLVPALQASRTDLNRTLKEGGRSGGGSRQNRARSILVFVEVALALVLLIGSALLVRTSIALQSVRPGFDARNVLVMQMSLSGERFEKTSEVDRLVRAGVEGLRPLPGIRAAAVSCCVPLETVWQLSFIVAGRPLSGPYHGIAGWTFVSPGYFDSFQIPVVRGRAFTDRDDAAAPGVVIINEAMARRVWPNSDPLNDRLLIGRAFRPEYDQDPARQIVGIVGDVRDVGLNRNPRPAMYVPIAQLPDGINQLNLRLLPVAWIVRSTGAPHSLASAIRDRLAQTTGLSVTRIRAMEEVAAQSTARTQLNMVLMSSFGLSALLLASIGIYGLIANSVQQRTQEIGIRLALGAAPSAIGRMVIVQGLRLVMMGAAMGLISAFGLTRLMAALLFTVKPTDRLVFAGTTLLLVVVGLCAAWGPARRATRIDPAEALRYE